MSASVQLGARCFRRAHRRDVIGQARSDRAGEVRLRQLPPGESRPDTIACRVDTMRYDGIPSTSSVMGTRGTVLARVPTRADDQQMRYATSPSTILR